MEATASVYKNITDSDNPMYYQVDFLLNVIRSERLKDKIEALRATRGNESENKKLKGELPSIVFQGKFTKRKDEYCEEMSGFAILDFDHLPDVEGKKKELMAMPYIYAAFVSPNGDGVKALARVPKQFARYGGYYRGLQKNHPELDTQNKNISRVCYMSSDANILINENATEFTEYVPDPKLSNRPIQYQNEIKIDDSNVIVKGLFKWWSKKYPMTTGGRNINIFILASSFNTFGIAQLEAETFCLQYVQPDFDEVEILKAVKSAYSYTQNFATQDFTTTNLSDFVTVGMTDDMSGDAVEESIYDIIFRKSFIDITKKIDYPEIAISMGEHSVGQNVYKTSFGTYGNFSAIVGASKSKKTFLKSLLVSAYVGGNTTNYTSTIKGHRATDKFIIDIDTEQGDWHAQNVFKRIPKICGGNPDFYKPFALRPYSHKERIDFIEYLIYDSEFKDNIGLMVIDGIADLVADFNDLKETNAIIQRVMRWTSDKNFHLMTIIHQNSTTTKATGHLGSSILKKAETVCTLAKGEDNTIDITFPYTRGFPIEQMKLDVDTNGLPFIIGEHSGGGGQPTPYNASRPLTPITNFSEPKTNNYDDLENPPW